MLTVSVIGVPPFLIYSNPLGGSDIDVLKIMAKKIGFSFKPKFERQWGVELNKEKVAWTGSIGSVRYCKLSSLFGEKEHTVLSKYFKSISKFFIIENFGGL